MIRLDHITQSFAGSPLFEGVSLSLGTGEKAGLSGVSGCGKTSLLRLIAGLDAPREGRVLLNGQEASRAGQILIPPHRRGIGYVFQSPALWPHMTVAQNILFGLGRMTRAEARHALRRALAQTGTGHLADRRPDTLSGGEQKRVAIARALAPEPPILLMDEPLANLDPGAREWLADMIRDTVTQTRATLIYVSHDPTEFAPFLNRILVIRDGTLREDPPGAARA